MNEIRLVKKPTKDMSFTETRIFKHQVIDKWKPETEIWALKYGDGILGSLCGMGGIIITYLFRRELKLLPYARLTCHVPVVGLSGLACLLSQETLVTIPILISEKCPLCLTSRASLIQLGFGLGYTLLAAPNVCFYMAERLLTYPVPPLIRAPKEVFNLCKRIVVKHRRTFFAIAAFQMIAASFVTYQKQNNLVKLNDRYNRAK